MVPCSVSVRKWSGKFWRCIQVGYPAWTGLLFLLGCLSEQRELYRFERKGIYAARVLNASKMGGHLLKRNNLTMQLRQGSLSNELSHGKPSSTRRYSGSTRPRASSVADSSSSISLSSRSRILVWNADLGIARIWNARATESWGGPPAEEEPISAVPARFARSRFVVSGTTRTDWSARVNVSLCQITTGLRPVCSRGRYAPRSAHQTSPRFNSAPLPRVRSPTQRDPAQQGQVHPHSQSSQASPNPSDWGSGAASQSGSHAHPGEGPTAPRAVARHSHNGLQPISRP